MSGSAQASAAQAPVHPLGNYPRASLLGLPLELYEQIRSEVIHEDEHGCPNIRPSGLASLQNLSLACRDLANSTRSLRMQHITIETEEVGILKSRINKWLPEILDRGGAEHVKSLTVNIKHVNLCSQSGGRESLSADDFEKLATFVRSMKLEKLLFSAPERDADNWADAFTKALILRGPQQQLKGEELDLPFLMSIKTLAVDTGYTWFASYCPRLEHIASFNTDLPSTFEMDWSGSLPDLVRVAHVLSSRANQKAARVSFPREKIEDGDDKYGLTKVEFKDLWSVDKIDHVFEYLPRMTHLALTGRFERPLWEVLDIFRHFCKLVELVLPIGSVIKSFNQIEELDRPDEFRTCALSILEESPERESWYPEGVPKCDQHDGACRQWDARGGDVNILAARNDYGPGLAYTQFRFDCAYNYFARELSKNLPDLDTIIFDGAGYDVPSYSSYVRSDTAGDWTHPYLSALDTLPYVRDVIIKIKRGSAGYAGIVIHRDVMRQRLCDGIVRIPARNAPHPDKELADKYLTRTEYPYPPEHKGFAVLNSERWSEIGMREV